LGGAISKAGFCGGENILGCEDLSMVAMMRCFGTKHQKHFIALLEGGRNYNDETH
jgi:hypothetical protein